MSPPESVTSTPAFLLAARTAHEWRHTDLKWLTDSLAKRANLNLAFMVMPMVESEADIVAAAVVIKLRTSSTLEPVIGRERSATFRPLLPAAESGRRRRLAQEDGV